MRNLMRMKLMNFWKRLRRNGKMSDDCCRRNYEEYKKFNGFFGTNTEFRINILKEFVQDRVPNIDIGCGSYMPKFINATHACDNSSLAKKYLKQEGWSGNFKTASVVKLPYKDQEFKSAVCSEVIEHLSTEKQVIKAFNEINRISEKWLITTPNTIIDDPDHKFFFTGDHLFDLIPFPRDYYIIIRKGIYFYISNDILNLKRMLGL